jgi:MFS superfamily sulfate permease-like transporter
VGQREFHPEVTHILRKYVVLNMICFIFTMFIFTAVVGIVIGVVSVLSGVGIILFVILYIKRKRKNTHAKLERGEVSSSSKNNSPHNEELTWIPTEQRDSMPSKKDYLLIYCSFRLIV